MKVLVVGASGVIGRRLTRDLATSGHDVVGSTRNQARTATIQTLGATPIILDVLDSGAVRAAVAEVSPEVIIHQATALSGAVDLRRFDRYFAATNALRTTGTRNLLAAATECGVARFIAQSYTGWPNERRGDAVKDESDPLDSDPPPSARAALDAIRDLEHETTSADVPGLVLRYGFLYGPETAIGDGGMMLEMVRGRRFPLVGGGSGVWSFIHIDDAVAITLRSVETSLTGIYNVVDDEPATVAEWLPYLAEAVGAKPPMRLPAWLARPLLGAQGVSFMTSIRGSSNAKAKRELDWELRYPSWRQGFQGGL